jgi:polyisoprenoid-binding protein YceI
MPRIIAAGAAVAVLAVAAFGGWYFLIRDDAPPPVSLADAVASLEATTVATTSGGSASDATAEPETSATVDPSSVATPEGQSGGGMDESLEGTWSVVAGESFVGYRVGEELARIGTTTAVGRTVEVSGTLVYDGAAITTVEIEADMTALQSDDDRRDRTLRNQSIETASFPTASFVLTQPIALDVAPEEGVPIAVTAVGELTLHGVTRAIEIPLEGQLTSGAVVVVGSAEILFADYDIEEPSALAVISVQDHGTIEFQLILQRTG